MIKSIVKVTALVAMLSAGSIVHAANESSIIIKTGSFSLSNATQTIGGSSITFDDSSSGVFALEYERSMKNNLSWGIEYISYTNDYASGTGYADAFQLMANIRKYFDVSKSVQPYVGAGVGVAGVSLGGVGTGTGAGIGFQVMGGVKFPFKAVSAIIEYKYISSEPEDSVGTTVDTSGSGIFAGIAINF
jgi:opacity protein-like surface antigen